MGLLAKVLQLIAILFRLFPFKNRVVLMSRQSGAISESYRLLQDELLKKLPAEQIVLCLCEPETKSKGAFIKGTLRQLFYANTSRFIVIDGYIPAVSIPKKPQKTIVMQVWHSMGAVKKFGYQCLDTPAGRSSKAAKAAHMHKNYDIIAASGPGVIDAYAQAFNYPEKNIQALGMLHLDYLLNPETSKQRKNNFAQACKENPYLQKRNKKIVIYAPTLRKGEGYENWAVNNVRALANACPDNACLVYCGHPLDRGNVLPLEAEFDCLHVMQDFSTVDVLEAADTVITDYSALAFDAALLKKNTIFYVPDIDKYKESPGLNINLEDPSICLASKDAKKIMQVAVQNSHHGFKAWKNFCSGYFKGITPYVAKRYAALICKALGK